ncbi:MAG TPA: ABC-F family ATP-binding cassette domain-containing protein [Bacteroidota bacterium]|nr:ABC-F family ATP-binding cassette domain-containing protein [Bacteroidota bacterium]
MLSLDQITMQFGARTLFEDVSFVIGPHDRIGLVGSNGTGKSTLLRIIGGIDQPGGGSINKAHYVTVGYLPQDGVIASGKTLYKEAETAFENVVEVQTELEEVQHQLVTLDPNDGVYAEVLEVFGELQHKLEDLDAFRMQSKVERVLMGLGFSVPDLERQTEEFSGGWQMRIALAKLLLKEPSVLLLDEPTNHLDIESLQWLEEYLRGYNGAVILVSHDRAFLDSLTTKTLALGKGTFDVFAGNYSFFERERVIRKEQEIGAFKNQQRQLKHTQQFIERFRYKATKARQVQSRIKALEKIEMVKIADEEEEIHFHFPQPQPSGVKVMELKQIAKSYGVKKVFEKLEYTIERGDRIAVVGPNGAGKSTFSRILAGVEPFDSGERIVGYNVILSYFGQHQAEELDLTKEALEIVDEVAVGNIRTKLRTILGSFLFHGDDVYKKVSVLSGGEKSRLALAKMLLQPANFLIMDEPTNHLDMRSKNVLQEALKAYEGTYVIVSHDRAFLDPLVTKVIEVTTGGIRTFLGNVSDYLHKKRSEKEASRPTARIRPRTTDAIVAGGPNATPGRPARPRPTQQSSGMGVAPVEGTHVLPAASLPEKDRRRLEAEQRQAAFKKLKPIRDKLEKLEKEIEVLEKRKLEIEVMMGDPDFYKDGEGAKKVSHEYKVLQSRLSDTYFQWNTVSEEIERSK